MMPTNKWLLFGLANDELGYIIPQSQWDLQPPFAYGRSRAQYGEINSCSSQIAPIVMRALAEQVERLKKEANLPPQDHLPDHLPTIRPEAAVGP